MSNLKDGTDKIQALLKLKETVSQADVPNGVKLQSSVESGVKDIEWASKLKRGPNTFMKLAIDCAKDSDLIYTFRILTTFESEAIERELEESKLPIGSIRYRILQVCLTLSAASRARPSLTINMPPELTVEQLKFLDLETLFALGYKYDEFVLKHSPRIEGLNLDQINNMIKRLNECEDDEKKSDLIYLLNLKQIHDLIIGLQTKLETQTEQMERVVTG